MRYDRNFPSLNRTAGALVTPSPLFLCSFPCGISRIACCLLLSFECTFTVGLLGRLTRRHFGSNTLRLRGDLCRQCSLPGEVACMLLPRCVTLSSALGAGHLDGFALPPLLDGCRILGVEGPLQFREHRFLCFRGMVEPVLKSWIVTASHS